MVKMSVSKSNVLQKLSVRVCLSQSNFYEILLHINPGMKTSVDLYEVKFHRNCHVGKNNSV